MLLGIDTGGTFTDFVLFDGQALRVHKVLSTPHAPEQAILRGIAELGVRFEGLHIIHGSTVATNAVLEGKLARTVYITNEGLRDTLAIGRQARRELYNLQPEPVTPPVPADYCLEVDSRLDARGNVLHALSTHSRDNLRQQLSELQPAAVAINLLFSFMDDAHEREIESLLTGDVFITRSSALLPVYREYERGITTWLNSATGPLMQRYLCSLAERVKPASLSIMQSSGDTIDVLQAANRPASLLLSGPAGGLMGARAMAALGGSSRLMTFDMGGTSTDVALIDGEIQLTDEGRIAHYPISMPMVDMHTIGAGGGSLAWIDNGGVLQVGPQSAGASPGPACYGNGGEQMTVTDANVVLGHLPSQVALGGTMTLDRPAAVATTSVIARRMDCSAEQAASGVLAMANEHMAQALRVISIEKGYDPKEFTLVSFGGAGGMHACDLAEMLGMKSILIPVHAGVLSALGMLVAPRGRRYMRTLVRPFSQVEQGEIENLFQLMETQGQQALIAEGLSADMLSSRRQVDVRYIGQSSALRIDWMPLQSMAQAFHRQHEKRYGHALEEAIELVNLHVSVSAASTELVLPGIEAGSARMIGEQPVAGIDQPVPVYERLTLGCDQILDGPVILVEPSATTWVRPGWRLKADQFGNIALSMMH